jgi:hypothetical protein
MLVRGVGNLCSKSWFPLKMAYILVSRLTPLVKIESGLLSYLDVSIDLSNN